MVTFAMRQSGSALPTGSISGADTDYRIIRVSGVDLNRFIPSNYAQYAIIASGSGPILRVSPAQDFFPKNPDSGPHFRLAPDLETVFSGRELRISVRARSPEQNGAPAIEINYSAGPEGQSGWHRFPLEPNFRNYSFEFTVPPANQDQGVDFLGIRPVGNGTDTHVEIESLTLVNLHLWRNAPPSTGAR